jgi:DNA-directed RNA polymerase specialized sigma24 family protein
MSRQPKYGLGEIRRLVGRYEEVSARKDTTNVGLRAVVALADIHRAITALPMGLKQVVLVHGLLGLAGPDAATALSISERAVRHRYEEALKQMEWTLNGGNH